MINLNKNHQKSITVENANIKVFFQAEYKAVQDRNLPYSTQFHTHSYVELFACIEGELKIRTHHGVITLTSGDVATVPSSVYHFKETDSSQNVKWYGIGFICRELYSPHSNDIYSFFSDIMEADSIEVYRGCHSLCKSFTLCYENRNDSEISSVLTFTAELLKLPRRKNSAPVHSNNSGKAKNIDRLLKLEDIINTGFYMNYSNKEIAESRFLIERQLSRIVAENYSMPLHALFVKKRLEGAAELLVTTHHSVEKISCDVGFKNKNAFNREFKKYYGMTPMEYRKVNTHV